MLNKVDANKIEKVAVEFYSIFDELNFSVAEIFLVMEMLKIYYFKVFILKEVKDTFKKDKGNKNGTD